VFFHWEGIIIMRIGGISLVQLLGIINFLLLLFQLSSGQH